MMHHDQLSLRNSFAYNIKSIVIRGQVVYQKKSSFVCAQCTSRCSNHVLPNDGLVPDALGALGAHRCVRVEERAGGPSALISFHPR